MSKVDLFVWANADQLLSVENAIERSVANWRPSLLVASSQSRCTSQDYTVSPQPMPRHARFDVHDVKIANPAEVVAPRCQITAGTSSIWSRPYVYRPQAAYPLFDYTCNFSALSCSETKPFCVLEQGFRSFPCFCFFCLTSSVVNLV